MGFLRVVLFVNGREHSTAAMSAVVREEHRSRITRLCTHGNEIQCSANDSAKAFTRSATSSGASNGERRPTSGST